MGINYIDCLSKNDRNSYLAKLAAFGVTNDLFDNDTSGWDDDPKKWPEIEFSQIFMHLIESHGHFTKEKLKAYKSLDAYNFYQSGWVRTVYWRDCPDGIHCALKAKVMRSQRTTDTPHEAWLILNMTDGDVKRGHCTCMAGLGEVCSHVAAVLFKLEAFLRVNQRESCTSLPCSWNQTFTKKVEPALVQDIDFIKPRHGKEAREDPYLQPTRHFTNPADLLSKLKGVIPNAAVFTVTEPKRPVLPSAHLPPPLVKLYDATSKSMSVNILHDHCNTVFSSISFNQAQAEQLELATRLQHTSSLWSDYRCGRITSSRFGEVCRTSLASPSKSVINSIMQYSSINDNTPSLKWGREKEGVALDAYREVMEKRHNNFEVIPSGLIIHSNWPHLGASPDAISKCSCCGEGAVEVKPPYSARQAHPCSVKEKKFYITKHDHHDICNNHLDSGHAYFYQVQGQMAISGLLFCDFVVYTPKGLHIERIKFDKVLWEEMLGKLDSFFKRVILPEIVTEHMKDTGEPLVLPDNDQTESEKVWCRCKRPESFDDMIACDGRKCDVEWFHLSCVGLEKAPAGKWYCENCKPVKKRKIKK